ncbi:MAG: SDR family NAD(P)-dependent oxidoreductase [Alphaproteobacteria bacterium]|nr:SDR family NAD(P)-dependent oxidoreductase [Alphaproteobacteria bacterium]
MREFTGQVAFISGAGSGIGRGMAEAFAAAGMKLVLGDVDGESVRSVTTDLSVQGADALAVDLDVADRASWDAATQHAESKYGSVDILCNNAGVAGLSRPVEEIPIEEWRWMTDINLYGLVHGLQCFVPRLKAKGSGHIVNTSSIGGLVPLPKFSEYMAAKHAVVGLSGSVRQELEPFGIGVSVLCPGAVQTALGETTVRQRPGRATLAAARSDVVGDLPWRYIEPIDVGRLTLQGITDNQAFIFTHPENRAEVEAQFDAMRTAFDALPG